MKIKAALIDLDDTICNSTPLHEKALQSSLEIFNSSTGLNWSFEKFKDRYNQIKKEIEISVPSPTASHNRALYFQRLVETLDNKADYDLAYVLYQTYYNYIHLNLRLYPQAETLLIWLKETGRKVVVVSDGNAHVRLKKINALRISKYIDYVVSSEEAGISKPAMQPFLLGLQKAEVSPKEAVMIGNSLSSDIYGANRVGIVTILANPGRSVDVEISNDEMPRYRINDLMKIKDIIEYLEKN